VKGDVFRALGDTSRRLLLDALRERDGQTLLELSVPLDMSRQAVMKHLGILEDAALITTVKRGREKFHYLNAVPIRQLHDRWIDKYRARTADALLDLKASLEDPMNATTALATTADAPPAHVFTVFIRTSPEALWDAITQSEFTLRYYYSSTVESDWRPGSTVAYKIAGEDAIVGTAIEVDPPRRLSMTFDARWDEQVAGDPPSKITWEIEPAGPGLCKLTVIHDGFASRTETYDQVGGGMPFVLSGLKTLLETGTPLMPEGAARTV
jgi:uncharacterized protein YndB with AHSA1/START domain/DNA-binding transcriptional ArsR family regulator